ncbi:MAG TPA: M56 family metallopeptidase [Acidimicrobiales bacterium]|jgi:Zn-dependent protease with chaperone function|nr:M56 family metallopeptidase [Acidimicrobiales bacterium]
MRLVMTAIALATFSVVLLGPGSTWLSRARWVHRAPRAGVLLWQGMGLGAILSGIGAGLALAATRYRAGFAGGTRQLVGSLFSNHPLRGLGLYDALGLTLAADLLIVLGVVLGVFMVRTVRRRARHRDLLDLVTYTAPQYPGTEFLADRRAIAYCLPGFRPRIVVSDGTRTLLDRNELWAVIHHERGHAHAHHGLVMLPMASLSSLFPWIPYARYAPESMGLLLEMAADDFSSRRSERRLLAAALVEMAANGWAPSCAFAAAGTGALERVSRLLKADPTSKSSAVLASVLGLAAVLVPVSAALLT